MGRFRDYRDLPPHYMRLEEGVFEAKGAAPGRIFRFAANSALCRSGNSTPRRPPLCRELPSSLLVRLDLYFVLTSLSADFDGLLQGSPSYVSRRGLLYLLIT